MTLKFHTEIKPLKDKYFSLINGKSYGPYNTWFEANISTQKIVSDMYKKYNFNNAKETALNRMKQLGIYKPRNQEREVEKSIIEHHKNLKD